MTNGPVPKRSDQRRRRNADAPIEKAAAAVIAEAPPLRPGIHPLAEAWYASLGMSGQSRYYEPSDWMTAQILAESIDSFAREPRASLLSAILAGSSSLLVTEGDRRRLRLELVRAAAAVEQKPRTGAVRPARRLRAVDGTAV